MLKKYKPCILVLLRIIWSTFIIANWSKIRTYYILMWIWNSSFQPLSGKHAEITCCISLTEDSFLIGPNIVGWYKDKYRNHHIATGFNQYHNSRIRASLHTKIMDYDMRSKQNSKSLCSCKYQLDNQRDGLYNRISAMNVHPQHPIML